MKHEMKLKKEYYNYILNGTKRIELRLNDEKRQQIKIGDTILFLKEPELVDSFEAVVVDIFKYKSFRELIDDFDMSLLADKSMSKKELLAVLDSFYPAEKQQKYGVLGLKIDIK